MPRNVEDLRMRLLTYIPEGREMPEAVLWMTEHGFSCADRVCRIASDAGAWTVVLKERAGRLADVEVR